MLDYDNEVTMVVALDGGHTFTAVVGPWDTDPDERMGDEAALDIAKGLAADGVALYGELDGRDCVLTLDAERIVTIALTTAP